MTLSVILLKFLLCWTLSVAKGKTCYAFHPKKLLRGQDFESEFFYTILQKDCFEDMFSKILNLSSPKILYTTPQQVKLFIVVITSNPTSLNSRCWRAGESLQKR